MDRPSRPSFSGRLTPVEPWPVAGSVDEHVRAEAVRAIYGQALGAQSMNLVVGALVVVALWRATPQPTLLAWLGTLAAAIVLRSVLLVAFRRHAPEPARMPRWELGFLVSLVIASLVWGAGALLIMPVASLVHQAILYFFLLGVAGGAAALYAAHARASTASIVCLLLPATAWFALNGGLELRVMAAAGLLYLVATVRAAHRFGSYVRRNVELSWALQRAYGRAQHLARTDELTGLHNRRAFTEIATQAVDHARRYTRPLAAVMFDIDHFKRINDSHGHAAGDAVLRATAGAVRAAIRAVDVAGRIGGEEFALLLPETGAADAAALAERLRRDIAALAVEHGGAPIVFTCSFGVAEYAPAVGKLDALLSLADQALYRAKSGGRNTVALAAGVALPA